jgi:hypothetical protein
VLAAERAGRHDTDATPATPATPAAPANDPTLVTTASGVVRGIHGDDHATLAWLGLPYAAPPIGALRWRAPAPPSSWSCSITRFTTPWSRDRSARHKTKGHPAESATRPDAPCYS